MQRSRPQPLDGGFGQLLAIRNPAPHRQAGEEGLAPWALYSPPCGSLGGRPICWQRSRVSSFAQERLLLQEGPAPSCMPLLVMGIQSTVNPPTHKVFEAFQIANHLDIPAGTVFFPALPLQHKRPHIAINASAVKYACNNARKKPHTQCHTMPPTSPKTPQVVKRPENMHEIQALHGRAQGESPTVTQNGKSDNAKTRLHQGKHTSLGDLTNMTHG